LVANQWPNGCVLLRSEYALDFTSNRSAEIQSTRPLGRISYLIFLCTCRSRAGAQCSHLIRPTASHGDPKVARVCLFSNSYPIKGARCMASSLDPAHWTRCQSGTLPGFCCKHQNAITSRNKETQVLKLVKTSNASVSRIYKGVDLNSRETPSTNSYNDTSSRSPQSPDPLVRLITYSGSYKRAASSRYEG